MIKVLIVDDDKIIRKGLKIIIEKNLNDFEIIGEASNGMQALEILKKKEVDLLLTDIKMPIMNGIELVKNIAQLNFKIKIIVISGYDEYQYVREALKSGAVDYLLKPVENSVLIELLQRIKHEVAIEYAKTQESLFYKEEFKKNISVLKETFLKQLLQGHSIENTLYHQTLEAFSIKNGNQFCMAAIGIDRLNTIPSSPSLDAPFFLLKEYLSELVNSCSSNCTFYTMIDKNDYLIWFTGEDVCYDHFKVSVFLLIDKLMDTIRLQQLYTVTVGVSTIYQDLDYSQIAYQEAALALHGKFYYGKNQIITYTPDYFCYSKMDFNELEEPLSRLINHIELGNYEKSRLTILDFMNTLSNHKISPNDLREICLTLISKICIASPEFMEIVETNPRRLSTLKANIKELDTFFELKDYLAITFFEIVKDINDLRSEKSQRVIEISKEYIRNHFKEPLTLSSVAQTVYLNPCYFSTLFKQETGKNFSDFLVETRINEAKKLLVNPKFHIYEIGRIVGYEETVSFNRAFKKIVGISPSKYRKIIK